MAKEKAVKTAQPGADLSGVLETIKGLHFDDRKKLAQIVREANNKDLDKNSYGGDPDGELYVVPEEPKEEKEEKKK